MGDFIPLAVCAQAKSWHGPKSRQIHQLVSSCDESAVSGEKKLGISFAEVGVRFIASFGTMRLSSAYCSGLCGSSRHERIVFSTTFDLCDVNIDNKMRACVLKFVALTLISRLSLLLVKPSFSKDTSAHLRFSP